MIFKHIFGVVDFKLSGDNTVKMLNAIRNADFICKKAYITNNELYGIIYGNKLKSLNLLAKKNNMEIEIINKRGLIYRILKYKMRFGIIAGFILSVALILFLSNTVLKIKITGCDENLNSNILSLLESNGVSPGKFIPSMNFEEIENQIIKSVNGISWATVRSTGGIITVDVHQSTPKPYMVPTRLPSNLIATKDAQIVKIDVFTGQLMVLKGEGVKKGDIIVSGFVQDNSGKSLYFHSQADIIGRYSESFSIEQPYNETIKIEGNKSMKRNYINFFSLKIPAFIGKDIKQECTFKENTNYISFFSLKLPLGVTHKTYTPFVSKEQNYTKEEAEQIILTKLDIYEKNFLAGCSIIDKILTTEYLEDKVKYSLEYIIEGRITEEREIMINN